MILLDVQALQRNECFSIIEELGEDKNIGTVTCIKREAAQEGPPLPTSEPMGCFWLVIVNSWGV